MLRAASCVLHPAHPVDTEVKRAADLAEIEHPTAMARRSSADYYPLLARAVAHLRENTSESRRSIYVQTETQLVRELRALDPPLPEAEITSERLSLHEAIRRVEAEAARSRLEFLIEKERDPSRRKRTGAHGGHPDYTSAAAEDYSPVSSSFKQASGLRTVVFAAGRIALVITFVVSGVFRLMDVDGSATMIASKLSPLPDPIAGVAASVEATLGMPLAQALAIAGAALEIVAGLAIATGIFTRSAALVLLVFTAASIYYFHNFWGLQNAERSDQVLGALSELSIMGALLILVAGTRPHASDASDDSAGAYVRRI